MKNKINSEKEFINFVANDIVDGRIDPDNDIVNAIISGIKMSYRMNNVELPEFISIDYVDAIISECREIINDI